MNLLSSIVDFSASMIEIFLAFEIVILVCKSKPKKNHKIIEGILIIIGAIFVFVCNQHRFFSDFTVLAVILYVSITAFIIYKIKFIFVLPIVGFYFLSLCWLDFTVVSLIKSIGMVSNGVSIQWLLANDRFRLIYIIIIKSIWYALYLIFKKHYKSEKVIKRNIIFALFFITVVGFILFLVFSQYTIRFSIESISEIWMVYGFLVMLGFPLYYYKDECKDESAKADFLDKQNRLLEQNFGMLKDIYTDNAKLYHDINNHLNILHYLLNKEEFVEARQYIENLKEPLKKIEDITWTGMEVLDFVINSEVFRANELGIDMKIWVEFPEGVNIAASDIFTLLTNLLDNGIEASQKEMKRINCNQGERPIIELIIRRMKHFIMIQTINVSHGKDVAEMGDLITTKADKKNHGWGLENVKSIVEKYNGSIKCSRNENRFKVIIMLCHEKK